MILRWTRGPAHCEPVSTFHHVVVCFLKPVKKGAHLMFVDAREIAERSGATTHNAENAHRTRDTTYVIRKK